MDAPCRRTPSVFAALSSLLALAGCSLVDADQARLCRIAIPALEPAGTGIAILHVVAIEDGVHIDYRSTPADGRPTARFAKCRFSPGLRTELRAVTTDRGEVPGATVYLLRRYYVETPEGAAGDPGLTGGGNAPAR